MRELSIIIAPEYRFIRAVHLNTVDLRVWQPELALAKLLITK